MVTVDELVKLRKEDLQAKYFDVIGTPAPFGKTKESWATDIVVKLSESLTDEEKQQIADKAAADKAAADKAAADKAAADKAAADKAAADKAAADKAAADKAAADKAAADKAAKPKTNKTVHLVKYEKNEAVDELHVTPEVWQNMPKGEKAKWTPKQPAELTDKKK